MEIIAEIGQAHDGSLGILHSYIDALAETGINTIKFQVHIADSESSEFEEFRVKFSYVDKTRFDYWRRMEFSCDQWREIKTHCESRNMEFLASTFSIAAVEMMESIGLKRYKIGSGELSNYLMLKRIVSTGKPILLSTGLSNFSEIDETIEFLKDALDRISIFQCTTEYPTRPENIGLDIIPLLKLRYKLPVGFSDHSGKFYTSLAAIAMGAEKIEFHAVFDRRMFGPDALSSLTISEISELVSGVRYLEEIFNSMGRKEIISEKNKAIFGKSIALRRDLKAGEVIYFEDLESKKPSNLGIPAKNFQSIIGKKINKDKKRNSFLSYDDLE
ncbi:MAG: N-acetylneuraminate synthase family protein [Ignavibacteriaceae bacterium]|nr:N-acetylneuraminate synthase family protein [Ignavibacteriaceae bacterium]